MKAAKKSDRIAAEGLVETYIDDSKKIGSIVEVNAETDFVAKMQTSSFCKRCSKTSSRKESRECRSIIRTKIYRKRRNNCTRRINK